MTLVECYDSMEVSEKTRCIFSRELVTEHRLGIAAENREFQVQTSRKQLRSGGYMYEEREIDLRIVLYQMLKRWRSVVILGIVIGLLFGAYKAIGGLTTITNDEKHAKVEEQYNIALDDYEATGRLLEAEIENIKVTRQRQEEYNSASVMMKINPLNEYRASFDIYIDSEYQINPELTYQNIDLTQRLMSAYQSYMTHGDLYTYILQNTTIVSELRYLTEILSFDINTNAAIITVSVRGVDEAGCNEIIGLVKTGFEKKYTEISGSIGAHKYYTLNESGYTTVDLDLDAAQKNNIQYLSELTNELTLKNDELVEWQTSVKPQPEYGGRYTLIQSIKFCIIGGVIGVFVGLMLYAFAAITTKRIIGLDYWKHMNVNILAMVPQERKKKLFSWIDRPIEKLYRADKTGRSFETECQIAAANLAGIMKEKDVQKVGVIGTCKSELLSEAVRILKTELPGIEVEEAGNILVDSAAVKCAQKYSCLIAVEEDEIVTDVQAAREIDMMKVWNKELIGVILLYR